MLSPFLGHRLRTVPCSKNRADLIVLNDLIESGKDAGHRSAFPLSETAQAIRYVAEAIREAKPSSPSATGSPECVCAPFKSPTMGRSGSAWVTACSLPTLLLLAATLFKLQQPGDVSSLLDSPHTNQLRSFMVIATIIVNQEVASA
jgi:hypothetical protein